MLRLFNKYFLLLVISLCYVIIGFSSCKNENSVVSPYEVILDSIITEEFIIHENSNTALLSSVIVSQNGSLIIKSGCTFSICDTCQLIVKGSLKIEGLMGSPVHFKGGEILIKQAKNQTNLINSMFLNCRIKLATSSLLVDSCFFLSTKNIDSFISADQASFKIENSSFKGDQTTEGIGASAGNYFIKNCIFDSIPDAVEFSNTYNGKIISTKVFNSFDDGVDLNNCENILIDSLTIQNSIDKGISIGNSKPLTSRGKIVITNSYIQNNKIGISLKGYSSVNIDNIYIKENKTGIKIESDVQSVLLEAKNSKFTENLKTFEVKHSNQINILNCIGIN